MLKVFWNDVGRRLFRESMEGHLKNAVKSDLHSAVIRLPA